MYKKGFSMSLDDKSGVTHNQTRISNSDRSQSTRYILNDNSQDDNLKRYEAMNRRNWIAVIAFVGFIVIVIMLIIILSLL